MFQMRSNLIGMCSVVAAVAVAGSAMASWTATYDFNDASLFQTTAGQAGATYYTGGDGGGFYPRSGSGWTGQSGVNTAYEAGAMRYTAASSGLGGARLYLNGAPDLATYRNDYWTPKMAKAENPYVSVKVFNGGTMTGNVTFYTLIATTPSTNSGVGLTGSEYRSITVKSTGVVNAGGGTADVSMASGWNTLAMQLESTGTLNYYLNGVNIRSVTGLPQNYLMDAWDSAAGFYSNGSASHLFDDFTVGSGGGVIPAPGAIALLGVAGLAGRRRRN
jgi:MYXO-CTERM domain-containing protein